MRPPTRPRGTAVHPSFESLGLITGGLGTGETPPPPATITCGGCGDTVTLFNPNPGFGEAAYAHPGRRWCGQPLVESQGGASTQAR